MNPVDGGRVREVMRSLPRTALGCLAAAGVLLIATTGTAHAAATWRVDHPPYTSDSSVPYAPLLGVSALSTSNVWAVGRVDGSALTEHWNGTRWTTVALPAGPCDVFESSCQLTGVSADAATDVIAVGNGTLNTYPTWTAAPLAFRYDGTAWHALALPAGIGYQELAHVKAFSPTDAWAIGSDATVTGTPSAVHWNGTAWSKVAVPTLTTLNLTMNAVSGTSGHDVWAVGTAESGGYRNKVRHSAVMHYDGTAWAAVTVPDTSGVLDVAALSPTDVWALGFDGTVLHFDGTAWTSTGRPGGALLGVVSPTDVWTGGPGGLAHYTGSGWTSSAVPSGIYEFTGSAALASGHVWFAGAGVLADNATTVPAVLTD